MNIFDNLIKCNDNDEIVNFLYTKLKASLTLERERALSILKSVINSNQISIKICEIIFFVVLSGTSTLINEDNEFKIEFSLLMKQALSKHKHALEVFQSLINKHKNWKIGNIIENITNK